MNDYFALNLNLAGEEEMNEEELKNFREAMLKEGISSFIVDQTEKKIKTFSRDMLINHFQKDVVEIEASFDKLCMPELEQFSELASHTSAILLGGLSVSHSEKDDLHLTCGHLLMNALTTSIGAFHLMRSGFRLQPGILVRNIIENVATSLHLWKYPNDLSSFHSGDFKSTRAIGTAQGVIVIMGRLYDKFSEHFAHISRLYGETLPTTVYSERDEALEGNLWNVKLSLWLVFLATELTFLDKIPQPRFWESLSPTSAHFNPSGEDKEWLKDFLGIDLNALEN